MWWLLPDSSCWPGLLAVLKPAIIAELEKHRDVEISERREKRKKAAEEEATKKDKDNKAKSEVNGTGMQVRRPHYKEGSKCSSRWYCDSIQFNSKS